MLRAQCAVYLELLPLVNSERAVLLDQPELLRELRGLERSRGGNGKDKVDHRGAGSRDDVANASSGALVLAQAPQRCPGVYVFHGSDERPRMADEHLFTRINYGYTRND